MNRAGRAKLSDVAGFVARIGGKVFVRRELCWIDENRDDDEGRLCGREPAERQVTLVQGTHGRN